MSWIAPLEMNLSITQNVYEGKWKNPWIATAQKIAIYTVAPICMIAIFESLTKFFVFNSLNVAIAVLNISYDFINAHFGN